MEINVEYRITFVILYFDIHVAKIFIIRTKTLTNVNKTGTLGTNTFPLFSKSIELNPVICKI